MSFQGVISAVKKIRRVGWLGVGVGVGVVAGLDLPEKVILEQRHETSKRGMPRGCEVKCSQ